MAAIFMTLKEVKERYKIDINVLKQNPKQFLLMFLSQPKEFRHWEFMWLKIGYNLCRLYTLRFFCILRFWVVCLLNGYFPWEIK